ncbi:MAG: PD-(D/E)XK nuclease-like domain-containing protein [Streptococcus sp.]
MSLKAGSCRFGLWPEKTETESLLVGNYVHSYFDTKEAHEAFLEMNRDKIISQRGKLLAR